MHGTRQFTAASQPSQRERRVGATGHDQTEPGGLMVQQETQGLMDWAGLDHVIIIKYENDVPVRLRDVVYEACQNGFDRQSLRAVQETHRLPDDIHVQTLQRGDNIHHETERIVVAVLQRQPSDSYLRVMSPAVHGPLAEKRGLAESRRGTGQRQFRARRRVPVHTVKQARPRDNRKCGAGT